MPIARRSSISAGVRGRSWLYRAIESFRGTELCRGIELYRGIELFRGIDRLEVGLGRIHKLMRRLSCTPVSCRGQSD